MYSFQGIFPLFKELNDSIYTSLVEFPFYVGSLVVGSLYGMLFAIFINFFGKHIIRVIFYGGALLWFMYITNCIKIEWNYVKQFFGINKINPYNIIHEIFSLYTVELLSFLISFLIVYVTLKKYAR